MTGIAGIGWWMEGSWGRMLSGQRGAGEGQQMFRAQFRNFGRLDMESKAAAYAVALALEDAGMGYPLAPETAAGIAGGSSLGCLSADLTYFRDYVECGRTLGRGNYFIYTLPTSPLAECAIHFGLEGPLLYAVGTSSPFLRSVEIAEKTIQDGQAEVMLAGGASADGAVFLALYKNGKEKGRITIDHVMEVLGNSGAATLAGAVELLDNLMKERGIRAAV